MLTEIASTRLALVLVFSALGWVPVSAAEEPDEPANSAARQQQLDKIDGLWEQAEEFAIGGQETEAIRLGQQALVIERQLHGDTHEDVSASFEWLAYHWLAARDAAKAIEVATENLTLLESALDKDHWQTVNARFLLDYVKRMSEVESEVLDQMVRIEAAYHRLVEETEYAEALENAYKLLAMEKEVLGDEHPMYANSWHNIAETLRDDGQYEEAEKSAAKALEIRKRALGEQHPDYADMLNKLAWLYTLQAEYAKSEPLYRQALAIQKRVFGEKHTACANSLSYLGWLYILTGDYAKAEPIYEQAVQIRRELQGEEHIDYGNLVSEMATLYEWMGDYAKAEPLHRESLEITRTVLGEEHRDYATGLDGLAGLLLSIGDYQGAEQLYKQTLEIRGKTIGTRHPDYASGLHNLAVVYETTGDYVKAEQLAMQALEIEKQTIGEEHPDYASSLHNLGWLHDVMGDYIRAESYYEQALEIRGKVLGSRHPQYAESLNSLAMLYNNTDEPEKAGELFEEALELRKAVLGEDHPDYATSVNDTAVFHESNGDYEKAEPLYKVANEIRLQTVGAAHPDYATGLHNLGGLYMSLGEFEKAGPLFRQALDIRKTALGETHPDYASVLDSLAVLSEWLEDYEAANRYARQVLDITRDHLQTTAIIQSERQQLAMNQMLRHRLDSYVSLALESGEFHSEAARQAILWKGTTLVRQRDVRLAADDPEIAERFRQLQQIATRLASLSRAKPTEDVDAWRGQVESLTAQKEVLESELSRDVAALRDTANPVTLDQIQSVMPADSVLVDYLQFTRSKPGKQVGQWESQTALLAIVVRPSGEPRLIELGPIERLGDAIDVWRESYGLSPQGEVVAHYVRHRVWEPLVKHVQDAKTVLVSTDGVLGRMPLGALPGEEEGKYLIEEYRLAMIPVPQLLPALVGRGGEKQLSRELLLMGDVEYDADPHQEGDEKHKKRRRPRKRAARAGEHFGPLPGTAGEIATIETTYRNLFEMDDDDLYTLRRAEATEANFRELAPQFYHLHLATHGFFASAESVSAFSSEALLATTARAAESRASWTSRDAEVAGSNPGLLSGLAFAGANREPTPDGDDGILTAQEIAFLPLGGVDTVVLSACETGLGESAGGEGLLGVQRSFQISGARTTMASFWKVDDLVTRRMMERFYRNLWEEEMSRLDALREAQLYILNNPEAVRGAVVIESADEPRTSPFYWGAFVLSGDWR